MDEEDQARSTLAWPVLITYVLFVGGEISAAVALDSRHASQTDHFWVIGADRPTDYHSRCDCRGGLVQMGERDRRGAQKGGRSPTS